MSRKIIGILAVSSEGYICHGDNNERLISDAYSPQYAELDFEYMKSVLREYADTCVFVVGENTLSQMGTLLNSRNVVVSTSADSGDRLVAKAEAKCIQCDVNKIVVLGGRSVYYAFSGTYTEMHVTVFKGDREVELTGVPKIVSVSQMWDGTSKRGKKKSSRYKHETKKYDLDGINITIFNEDNPNETGFEY